MSVRVNEENFKDEILDFNGIAIADFYSDSCIPCKRMSPLLAEIEEEYSDIKLAKINVNFENTLSEKYEIQAAPTLVFFKNGKESERLRGAVKKSEITDIINKLKQGE